MRRPMFTVAERDQYRAYLIDKGRADNRIVAGAALGSEVLGTPDRWSDLDLTFGVREDRPVDGVLEDWTEDLARTFGAQHLFDLQDRQTVYRVFLFPGNLQVDLSFTPGYAAQYGPKFKLLFGTSTKSESRAPTDCRYLLGLGIHHALRARYSIERDRGWQAEYWISAARNQALALACRRRGLEDSHGRGLDQLPSEVLAQAQSALVRSTDAAELLRALKSTILLLLQESEGSGELAAEIEPQLRDLGSADWH